MCTVLLLRLIDNLLIDGVRRCRIAGTLGERIKKVHVFCLQKVSIVAENDRRVVVLSCCRVVWTIPGKSGQSVLKTENCEKSNNEWR